jgi:hypothetical protein
LDGMCGSRYGKQSMIKRFDVYDNMGILYRDTTLAFTHSFLKRMGIEVTLKNLEDITDITDFKNKTELRIRLIPQESE